MNEIERENYPKPDMIRTSWIDLNGIWKFQFDDTGKGEAEQWYHIGLQAAEKIQVPFCYQSEASGISDKGFHEIMWYERTVWIPEQTGGKCLLHFGAIDYVASVWVNGRYAGGHRGGNCEFCLDISACILGGRENRITVKCIDSLECTQPRGKQFWGEKGERIWYSPVSGIWKSVWLEFTGSVYIRRMLITPDIDNRLVCMELELDSMARQKEYFADIEISHDRNFVKRARISLPERNSIIRIDIQEGDYADEVQYWSPENPWLYDMVIRIEENETIQDEVYSYFGMRKVSIRGNQLLLNNKPYYQRLVLDQGYWYETLLTPPSAGALAQDILLAKQMGFNGARKHQKVEDARYYYLADKLGFLVWGEMPSAYQFCTVEMENVTREWSELVLELYNHPSVIVWVPLNESWGVRNIVADKKQQMFASHLYRMTKAVDNSRLISNNDGWEQIEDSDICGIHDYTPEGELLEEKFSDFDRIIQGKAEHRLLYSEGHRYESKPVLLTEFGGIAFESDNLEDWGYYDAVKSETEFLQRFRGLVEAVGKQECFSGYCYTQLTDVFQEKNGLLNFDRSSKIDMKKIREIVEQSH